MEEIKKLIEKHPPPENCSFISVPKLNAEIIAAVQETAIKRDKRIVEKQERIAACLSIVGRSLTIALKIDDNQRIELLKNLSEMGRLLASVHREESLARKSLILANLNSSLKTTLSNTTVDEWLFSADLEGLIKSANTLDRDIEGSQAGIKTVSAEKKLERLSSSTDVQSSCDDVGRISGTFVVPFGFEEDAVSQGGSPLQETQRDTALNVGKLAGRL